MSDLPTVVEQAGVLLQNPLALQDAEYRKMIIDWGYQQIDAEYPLDPVRAPLNRFRRIGARMEWERTIRTNGKELRSSVAGTAVRELQFQLQRREEAIRAADQLRIQQEQTRMTSEAQIDSYTRMKEIDFVDWERRARLEQHWQEAAAAADSRRRMEERINDAAAEISILLSKAKISAMGTSSADMIFEATDRSYHKTDRNTANNRPYECEHRRTRLKAFRDSGHQGSEQDQRDAVIEEAFPLKQHG